MVQSKCPWTSIRFFLLLRQTQRESRRASTNRYTSMYELYSGLGATRNTDGSRMSHYKRTKNQSSKTKLQNFSNFSSPLSIEKSKKNAPLCHAGPAGPSPFPPGHWTWATIGNHAVVDRTGWKSQCNFPWHQCFQWMSRSVWGEAFPSNRWAGIVCVKNLQNWSRWISARKRK